LRQNRSEQIHDRQGAHKDLFDASSSQFFLFETMIPAEVDFIKVTAGVFATHILEDPLLGPFDQRPEGLCSVVVYQAASILLARWSTVEWAALLDKSFDLVIVQITHAVTAFSKRSE
jgi:hypothetical protein